jgi:hypothetical protein
MAKARQNARRYEVLIDFTDSEDKGTVYWAGKDLYPREGHEPTKERITYLQSDKTRFKQPVISGKARQ